MKNRAKAVLDRIDSLGLVQVLNQVDSLVSATEQHRSKQLGGPSELTALLKLVNPQRPRIFESDKDGTQGSTMLPS